MNLLISLTKESQRWESFTFLSPSAHHLSWWQPTVLQCLPRSPEKDTLEGERGKWNGEVEIRRKGVVIWAPAAAWPGEHPNWVLQRAKEMLIRFQTKFSVCVERRRHKKMNLGMKRKQQHRFLEDVSAYYPNEFSAYLQMKMQPFRLNQQRTPPESHLYKTDTHIN